jgi:hypothetical protein
MDSLYQCSSYVNERQGNQVVNFDLHVGASATASVDAVSGHTDLVGGSGYSSGSPPLVTFAAAPTSGTRATGSATVSPLTYPVGTVTVDDGGSYTFPQVPVVNIAAPTSGIRATATAIMDVVSGMFIHSIDVGTGGSGYTTPPAITFTGGGETSPASATAVLGSASGGGAVTGITIGEGGDGYTSAPGITFGGSGGASATALLQGIGTITVDAGGKGYTSAPTVTITGGGGSSAEAAATISGGEVTGFTVDPDGTGYTSAPTVLMTPSTTVEFTINLHEPLRIDKLSEIYLDHFTTFNCVVPNSATNAAFIMELKEFNVKSDSNNQKLAFGRVTIPNSGGAKVSHSTGLTVHRGSKMNYICQVNPMTLTKLTIKLTVLDGSTSIFLDPANGHRCFGELVIVPRK